ncbi:PKD domain-containing protein [Flavitalea flava]
MKSQFLLLLLLLGNFVYSQTTKLTVKKVMISEYRAWYIASDGNIYCWNDGSAKAQQYPIGGRKAIDGAGAFNVFRVLDDQGYIWTNILGFTTNTIRYNTDTTGAPFNGNIAVYAYANTTVSIRSDNSVWLFGDDTLHLFHKTRGVNMRATKLSPAGMKFKKLVFGNRLVGLTTTGEVWEWTYGDKQPVKKNIPAPATDIFASHLDYAGCIIPATAGSQMGYPYVWGIANRAWGGTKPYPQPTSVKTLWGVTVPIKEISANWNTTHYIDSLGRLFGFGFNSQGEVGNGEEFVNRYTYPGFPAYAWSFTDFENPTGVPAKQIGTGTKWAKLFSNNFFAFYKYALDVNDSLYSWGRNKAMVLGNAYINLQEATHPNAMDVTIPTMVHPLSALYQAYNFSGPSISAGPAQSISGSTVTLTGTAAAPQLIKATSVAANKVDKLGYNIAAYQWTKVSGPGGTISSPNAATTTVTGLTKGTYVFNLVATDNNKGTQSAKVTVKVNGGEAAGKPPVPNAGPTQTITLPVSSVALAGSGTDPDGTIASYAWTKTSGPATFAISNAAIKNPVVSKLVAGAYVFRLTVVDNSGLSAYAEVTVKVNSTTVTGKPPVVSAGANQTTTLPINDVLLYGSATDPDGTIVSYAWTKISGPVAYSINSTAIKSPFVSNMVAGTYVFRLTARDNSGMSASADVSILVKSSKTPLPPAVPASGNTKAIPGKIEAEAWDAMSGVETQKTSDAGGGLAVGWINNGDWMDYKVTVASAGTYTVSFRLSSPYIGASLQLKLANGTMLATLNAPVFGKSFKDWETVSTTVVLPAGKQTIRLSSVSNTMWNINWMSFTSGFTKAQLITGSDQPILAGDTKSELANSSSAFTIYPNPFRDNLILDMNNPYSGTLLVQIVNQSGSIVNAYNIVKDQSYLHTSLQVGNLPPGIYFIRVQTGNYSEVKKLLKL